jgi:hypothetical protein
LLIFSIGVFKSLAVASKLHFGDFFLFDIFRLELFVLTEVLIELRKSELRDPVLIETGE